MKVRSWVAVCTGLINVWGFPQVASGGQIILEMRATTEINKESLLVRFEITNLGDEYASNVAPSLWIDGHHYRIEGSRQLLPNHTLETKFETRRHPYQEPGNYYIPMHIQYRDQAGARFMLPYLVHVTHGEKEESGLEWTANKAVLPTVDSIQVSLSNMDPWRKEVFLESIAAMSIQFELPDSPVELNANERKTWELKIKHDVLWPNSYFNYLIASYSHKGHHYSKYVTLETQAISESSLISPFFSKRIMTTLLIALIVLAITGKYASPVYRKLWQKHS